jgi:hypothetical protein
LARFCLCFPLHGLCDGFSHAFNLVLLWLKLLSEIIEFLGELEIRVRQGLSGLNEGTVLGSHFQIAVAYLLLEQANGDHTYDI